MADHVGQRFGDYRLMRFLGQGSFGDVYLCEHTSDKSLAAVKVLQVKLTSGEDFKEFIDEARNFRLKHSNIVQLLDFGIEDNIPFLIMDYAPNGTLRQRYPRGTRLPLSTIVTYVKQIAAALQYAHDRKLIHRDVKPENILLGSNNEVLLSDFGIASLAHSTRSLITGKEAGTVPYMAPEQLKGKPRTASDQYALGIMVYEWLCGERPFNGTYWEIVTQHLSVTPPSLCEKVSTVSPEVEQVVMTALAKESHQRFVSVQAFANALEQVYQSKPAIGTILLTYRGHSDRVNAVAWSPDGSRIASASDDGTVHVWNAASGRLLLTCNDNSSRWPSSKVYSVTWSPDGTRLASCHRDGALRVWEATTGHILFIYPKYRDVSWSPGDVSWSPDGIRIASCHGDGKVHVLDAVTGRTLLTTTSYHVWVRAVSWSPDGTQLAACYGDGNVRIWDLTTGYNLLTYGYAHDMDTEWFEDWDCDTPYPLKDVSWSPDGTHLASAGAAGVELWEVSTESIILIYGVSHTITAVSWSPDGIRLASGSSKGVEIWDAITGTHVYTHGGLVYALKWSPDGRYIASASEEEVQVWHAI